MNNLERWQQTNEDYLAAALRWLRLRLLYQIDSSSSVPEPSLPRKRSWLDRLFHRSSQRRSTAVSPLVEQVSKGELARAEEAMAEAERVEPRPALIQLCQRFGLSRFEQQVLLLCAAMELDPRIARLCAQVQGNPHQLYPTFALALSLFEEPAWDSLSPDRPLRYWRLNELPRRKRTGYQNQKRLNCSSRCNFK